MIRGRWVCTPDGLVPAHEYYNREKPQRSSLSAPMIISDHIHELVGQHDGKVYTSKSALRRSYKAAGVEEVGNEPQRAIEASERRPRVSKDDVGEAVRRVKNGYRPTEAERVPELDD